MGRMDGSEMLIQITMSGQTERLEVQQVGFVMRCHYFNCRKEFITVDPDQVYCDSDCRKLRWWYNNKPERESASSRRTPATSIQ